MKATNSTFTKAGKAAVLLVSVALLFGLSIPTLLGGPAQATLLDGGSSTTCATYPGYTCVTTTSSVPPSTSSSGLAAHPKLSISYSSGIVTWQECGFTSPATGSTDQLYLDGEIQTQSGGSGPILSSGCTADLSFPKCLAPGSYPAVAVDQPYGSASSTLTVTQPGCLNPITLGQASASTPTSSGHLAFTGTDILLLVVAACFLFVVGLTLVRLTRRRQAR